MLGVYLQAHPLSGELIAQLLAYAISTVLATAAVLAIVRAKRPIVIEPQPGVDGKEVPNIELSLVIGGVVVPLVIANFFTYLPSIPAELIGPQAVAWVDKNFFSTGPLIWVDAIFCVGYFVAIVAACIFGMLFNFDADWVARHLADSGYQLRGISGAAETASALGAIALRTTVIGGIAVAILVVAVPVLFHVITGVDRAGLNVGGSAFVIAAALLADALAVD
jgi:preprotein translocase subunit SecY